MRVFDGQNWLFIAINKTFGFYSSLMIDFDYHKVLERLIGLGSSQEAQISPDLRYDIITAGFTSLEK